MTVRYQSSRDEIMRRLREAQNRALEATGIFVLGETINRCPVRTGRLRDSYVYKVNENENQVIVGTNVEYGPYVEFGTSRMEAQPHLRPAVTQNLDRIQNLIRDIMQQEMR